MTTPVQVRVDTQVKQNVTRLFSSLGLDMSSAINIFLHQCVITGGLPFEVYNPKYNKETIKAIEEAKKISKDKRRKRFTNIDDLFKDLDK